MSHSSNGDEYIGFITVEITNTEDLNDEGGDLEEQLKAGVEFERLQLKLAMEAKRVELEAAVEKAYKKKKEARKNHNDKSRKPLQKNEFSAESIAYKNAIVECCQNIFKFRDLNPPRHF